MSLKEFLGKINDYIFPIFCLGCKKEGEWLCEECFNKLNLSGVYFCPVCHKPQAGGVCCGFCRNQSFIESEIAITIYKEKSLVGNIIHTFKYSLAEDVVSTIEDIINIFFGQNLNIFADIDCIVPVPLHRRRLAERGFNQAELIADIVSKNISKPINNLLQRARYTPHQARLSRDERLKNVVGAFSLDEKAPARVLLVDDVFTTGSTMRECAKELKKQGVEKVYAFTLARG